MTFPIRVRVPASSANLGSGFDTLGMGLTFYNVYEVLELLPSGTYQVEVVGEGSRELEDPAANLVIRSYEAAFEAWEREAPGLVFRALNAVPLCRGLGSSAGAVVGGVLLANALRERPLSKEACCLSWSVLKGTDNVVPCCVGGMVVSCWDGERLRYLRLTSMPPDVSVVVAVPEFRVSTKAAGRFFPRWSPSRTPCST
jgi:homoserine kinase